MMTRVLTFCFVVLTISPVRSDAAGSGGTTDLANARRLEDAGKSSAARAAFAAIASQFPDARTKAEALLEISRINLAEGRYRGAIDTATACARIAAQLKDSRLEGDALTSLGLAKLYSGDYSDALRDFENAVVCARRIHDAANEVTRLNNIGTVFYFQGRYADALREYESAMTLVTAAASSAPWTPARRQLTEANIATVYQRLGQYDQALAIYSNLRASSPSMQVSEQAQLLANMGALYRHLGDPIKALQMYRDAQALYRRSELRSGEIAVLNNIGIAQALDLNRFDDALRTFREAASLAKKSGDKPLELHSGLYSAETLYRERRFAESEKTFHEAAETAASLNAVEERWKALYGLARIAKEQGNDAKAKTLLRTAIDLIESIRGNITAGFLRTGFLADKRDVYDLLIAELASGPSPDTSAVFHLMEQSRARSLQDKTGRTLSLTDVRTKLLGGTALVEYWVGSDVFAILYATRETSAIYFARLRPTFRRDLANFVTALANGGDSTWKSHRANLEIFY